MKVGKGQSSPLAAHIRLLNSLHGSGSTILIPGFDYDSGRETSKLPEFRLGLKSFFGVWTVLAADETLGDIFFDQSTQEVRLVFSRCFWEVGPISGLDKRAAGVKSPPDFEAKTIIHLLWTDSHVRFAPIGIRSKPRSGSGARNCRNLFAHYFSVVALFVFFCLGRQAGCRFSQIGFHPNLRFFPPFLDSQVAMLFQSLVLVFGVSGWKEAIGKAFPRPLWPDPVPISRPFL